MKKEGLQFLFLSQEDMIKAGVLEMRKCVEVMDEAFRVLWQGDCLMGGPAGNSHGFRLWFPREPRGPQMPVEGPDRRFMSMITYLGGSFNVCGEKWYGSNVKNPEERHLPRSIHLVVLNDPLTGAPLAVMDGTLISAMRTGAVVGLGAKYLAAKESRVAGIVGAGVISKTSLSALSVPLGNLKEVKVFDIVRSKAESFSGEMSKKLGINVYPVDTLEESVKGSDVIAAAPSGVKKSTYASAWFKKDSFFAMSSDADVPDEIWFDSRIVADNWKMHMDWLEEAEKVPGEVLKGIPHLCLHSLIREQKIKNEDVASLAEVAFGGRKGGDKGKVVFITGGMAIEDIAWGCTVYRQALEKGIGQNLELWNQPYWI